MLVLGRIRDKSKKGKNNFLISKVVFKDWYSSIETQESLKPFIFNILLYQGDRLYMYFFLRKLGGAFKHAIY